jgi:secreted trypsin-like serine protease
MKGELISFRGGALKQFLSRLAYISFCFGFCCFFLILQGCQKNPNQSNKEFVEVKATKEKTSQTSSIVGGANVQPNSGLAKKLFYLALGVEIKFEKGTAVSLTSTGVCTATAIQPRVLITAAHCVIDIPVEKIFVTIRKNPWAQSLDMKDWIKAAKVLMHPKYNHKDVKLGYDVALIQLERDLPPGSVTKIVSESFLQSEFSIVSAGFGRTSVLKDFESPEIGKIPSLLNFVERNVTDFSVNGVHIVIDQKDHKGICFGDSGGPALHFDSGSNEHYIIGVASYVSVFPDEKAKADPDDKMNSCIGQGHYTSVFGYLEWIQAVLQSWK